MNERLVYLHGQFKSGKASLEELRELLNLLDDEKEKEVVEELLAGKWNEARMEGTALSAEVVDAMADRILAKNKPKSEIAVWRMLAAASVLAAIAVMAYWWLQSGTNHSTQAIATVKPADSIIPPAQMAARLTLDDGTVKLIDSLPAGWMALQGTAGVQHNGQLLQYTESGQAAPERIMYNTLATGLGETFPSLQLADGTRVWLNAGSSIKFPVSFSGLAQREVEVSGEVYFEVAKNPSKPFLVRAARDTITVLGTHFNVNSYADEPFQCITLLEGAVALSHLGSQILLKPGEAAVSPVHAPARINQVNTAQAVAWKDDMFYFDRTDITSAMRQIARWYNLDIECRGNAKRTITGQLPRAVPAATLFKALQLSGNIHYKMEGRHVEIIL